MNDFFSQVKSTIDRMGFSIAQAYGSGTHFIDLDDTAADQASVTSGGKAIVWVLDTLEPSPRDPLFTLMFSIGARTLDDPGRYTMADLLDAVGSAFTQGGTYPIYDYTPGGDGATKRGDFTVVSMNTDPQMFDKQSGLRMITIVAKAVRAL